MKHRDTVKRVREKERGARDTCIHTGRRNVNRLTRATRGETKHTGGTSALTYIQI